MNIYIYIYILRMERKYLNKTRRTNEKYTNENYTNEKKYKIFYANKKYTNERKVNK